MKKTSWLLGLAAFAAGCAGVMQSDQEPDAAQVKAVLEQSFHAKGQAKMDRLDQDDVQRLCSGVTPGHPLDKEAAERLVREQLAAVKYPAGSLEGDWKRGEAIAQSGQGKQYSDDPSKPSGGNCYACHELTREELSFGTIGPSLYQFGRKHGFTPESRKYVYGKVYNSQAFVACSSMPRFGHKGILTEQQIKDVTALLTDPASPVNK
ncbi:MAG TPA: sulfur oxidation c-type cytochrome SoxX [Usitatibacter sp.]|nr:sulfur oxidation c-type cytochrome SoxX [Usitatibacter sp.]